MHAHDSLPWDQCPSAQMSSLGCPSEGRCSSRHALLNRGWPADDLHDQSHSLCFTYTAMDGFRPDAIVIDAQRSFHLPKVIVFLGVEGLLIATGVLAYSEPILDFLSFSDVFDVLCAQRQPGTSGGCPASLCQAYSTTSTHSLHKPGLLPAGGGANIPQELRIGRCNRLDYQCEISTAVTVLVAIIVACFIG